MHCKSYSHFFSKKFQHICVSLDVNFNESLTNDIVSFEQLGPVCSCFFFFIISMVTILEAFHYFLHVQQIFIFCRFFGKQFEGHFSRNTELIHAVAPLLHCLHLNSVPHRTQKVCCCLQLSFNLEFIDIRIFVSEVKHLSVNQLILSYMLYVTF